MIRLIASDIDGTLLPYGETAMPQRFVTAAAQYAQTKTGRTV